MSEQIAETPVTESIPVVSQIEILIPESKIVTTSQGEVKFRKFKFSELGQVLKLMQKYFRVITEATESNIALFASALGEEAATDIAEFISIFTGKKKDFLDELYADEVFTLFITCIKVNINFLKGLYEKEMKPINPQVETTGD